MKIVIIILCLLVSGCDKNSKTDIENHIEHVKSVIEKNRIEINEMNSMIADMSNNGKVLPRSVQVYYAELVDRQKNAHKSIIMLEAKLETLEREAVIIDEK